MSVIRTDKWLLDFYDKPAELCEKLTNHFDENVSSTDIHQHMIIHGMYHQPVKNGDELIKSLQKRNIWQVVQQEEKHLQKEWDGPNIPIFIFPADSNNRRLKQEQNGKSGLTFSDKLFLFISEDNTEREIRALFTHEYNHVCRLYKYNKKETDYVLLDSVMLEGLAENAVQERLGSHYTANWTSYYPDAKLKRIYLNLIWPNRNTPKSSPTHSQILYGLGLYPKMAGYCTGYYLIKNYMAAHDLTSRDVLHIKSEEMIEKTDET
ncbi:Uncharacterized protein YjaZ [Lentibacillus halodurans]|uniref:Uncharacterized protein YjaZ n=1 Tax=Lentibacillus halodurans TaxID=237679 RepID=A0A1I0W975_9BACI|nr:DUF2268 domain-containing putative Zn-dependent protease [Lentibacillus halodurans]SFA85262.1 Uncharacterized protein YjaZ [Lentibacillus halodurans]